MSKRPVKTTPKEELENTSLWKWLGSVGTVEAKRGYRSTGKITPPSRNRKGPVETTPAEELKRWVKDQRPSWWKRQGKSSGMSGSGLQKDPGCVIDPARYIGVKPLEHGRRDFLGRRRTGFCSGCHAEVDLVDGLIGRHKPGKAITRCPHCGKRMPPHYNSQMCADCTKGSASGGDTSTEQEAVPAEGLPW